MTGAEERQLLADYLATCERLADSFREVSAFAEPLLPMTADRINALEGRDGMFVLAFLKSFEQFEDALGRTLKTIAQLMALGKIERLTPRDVANKAEAFGIVDRADHWSEAVRTRNALAHEYPLRPDKRAEQLNRAWEARSILTATWAAIQAFVQKEGLIEP